MFITENQDTENAYYTTFFFKKDMINWFEEASKTTLFCFVLAQWNSVFKHSKSNVIFVWVFIVHIQAIFSKKNYKPASKGLKCY